MTHEQMLHQLNSIRENLEHTLDQVKDLIDDARKNKSKAENVGVKSTPVLDSFSEEKEKFIAP